MTSAARGRAVGVVAVLLVSAGLAGSETVPVRTGGAGTDPLASAPTHGAPAHAHASQTGPAPTTAPTGLEVLAELAADTHTHSAADDRRAAAQGLRRARKGSLCEGGYELASKTGPRCSHGDDHELAGVAPLLGGGQTDGTSRSAASAACIGDGQAGARVQLMYVRRSNQGDRFSATKAKMIDWAATIDEIMVLSARETGGVRRVRWATDDTCRPTVLNIALPTSVNTFGAMVDALTSRGYTASNRKYLIAAEMGGYCGLGESVPDERPDAGNYNNGSSAIRAMFASVSAVEGCWVDTIAAHEVMHTLGAVQRNAPNATRYGHCTDDADIMCYRDGQDTPPMRSVCASSHEDLYDCNHDDYFSTNAVSGYLRDNWNTANSSFLDATGSRSVPFAPLEPSATPRTGSATVTWDEPAFDGGFDVTGYLVTASPSGATASTGPDGRSVVVPGLADGVATIFTVQAVNPVGLSPASASTGWVTPTPVISTPASFSFPWGLAAGPSGSAYVTDRNTRTVVRVAVNGTKTVVAGGSVTPTNPPIDPAPAIPQAIDAIDVAVHPTTGDLYVSDRFTNRIRRISGGFITSVTTVSSFAPGHLAFAPDGTLYVIDEGRQRVRRVDSATSVPTVAGNGTVGFSGDGGAATSAQLFEPSGLATDTAGNLYIAELGNHRVRRVTPGGQISTVAGDGGLSIDPDGAAATATSLPNARAVAWSDGRLYVQSSGAVRVVGTDGTVSTWVGKVNEFGDRGDGGPASLARFQYVSDLAVSAGRLLLVDTNSSKLRRLEPPTPATSSVPAAPLRLRASSSPAGALVDWVPPANGGSPITSYELTFEPGGLTRTVPGDKTYAVVYGLGPGDTYTYRVRAVNAFGRGPQSVSNALIASVSSRSDPFGSVGSFIKQQYRDFLDREPTTVEYDADRAAMLAEPPLTQADLILRLMRGRTYGDTYGPVARLYFAYFLRAPDLSGLDHWRAKLRSGSSLATVSQAFASSGEFQSRYGSLTNRQFVETVYVNVLGRPGDPGGVGYWTGQLDAGSKTRGAVMVGFSESNEYKRVRAPEIDTILLYRALMARVPSRTEFPVTVARVADGLPLPTLIGELLHDPAYHLRTGLDL